MDFKKMMEDLLKEVSALKKAVDEKKGISKEELDKRATEIADKQLELRKAAMLAELRKGSYSGPVEDENREISKREVIVEKSDDPKVQAFQKFNDDVYILSKILRTHPTHLKLWNKYSPSHSELKKAMDSATASEGLEWIPTEFSADLIDRFRLARKVAALFPEIRMPSNPYKLPSLVSDSTAYLVSENTADDPATKSFRPSKPGSGNITLTAVKLGSRVNFSEELSEDSIIPILDMIKNNLAVNMVSAHEDALINGDTAVTHMDADVTLSYDARKSWNGLRKLAPDASQVSLATFTAVTPLRSMRAALGKYGVNPNNLVFLVSSKGYQKMLGLAELITVDKYGPAATIISGELAKVDGIPVIVSEFVRDSLNATGVNDATTNNKSEILLCYVPGYLLGERRKMTLKSFEDVQNDQTALVTSWRGDFKPIYTGASDVLAVEGVNLTV